MADGFFPFRSREELEERIRVSLLQLAVLDAINEDADRLEENWATQPDDADLVDSVDQPPEPRRPMTRWQHALRKQRAHQRLARTLPKVAGSVAALLLICYISLTVAVAAIPMVRVKVLQFLVDVQDEYTRLHMTEDPSQSFEVPAEWKGDYFPSFIPEGYGLAAMEGYDDLNLCRWTNEQGDYLIYQEMDAGLWTTLNTESGKNHSLAVRGYPGVYSDNGHTRAIYWSSHNRYFSVTGILSQGELILMAEGVYPVR